MEEMREPYLLVLAAFDVRAGRINQAGTVDAGFLENNRATPLMEGGDRSIQLPGRPADRARADRPAKDRQQRPGHLARHRSSTKQGDRYGGPSGVGTDHFEGLKPRVCGTASSIAPWSVRSQRG